MTRDRLDRTRLGLLESRPGARAALFRCVARMYGGPWHVKTGT